MNTALTIIGAKAMQHLLAGVNWACGASRTTKLFLWYRGKLFLVGDSVGLGKAHYTAVPFLFS